MYSRLAYFGIRAESAENTPLTPNVFLGPKAVDVVTQYKSMPSSPILGVRDIQINPVKAAIDPPEGTLTIQVEGKGFGYLLKAIFGSVNTGRYFPVSGGSGTFTVGETITGGTSSATATVVAFSAERDYILVSSISGTFQAAETLTGGSSSATATLGTFNTSVYGHEFKAPQNSLPTYTVDVGYLNEAFRLTGVRFHSITSLKQEDNILTAEIAFTARAEFKHARVTAAVTSGAGSKVIPVDQTQGLTTSDSIKVFRPSTGAFLDFASSGVKTHTPGSISSETSVTVTNLQTALAVGDLLMLAPATPSYSLAKEFSFIGGCVIRLADTVTSAIAASGASIEDFELVVENELEGRHGANAANMAGRFPTANHLKGLTASGSLTRAYPDMTMLDRMRNQTQTALQIRFTGDQIAATGLYYTLDFRLPDIRFNPFHPPIDEDNVLDEEMEYTVYRDSSAGYTAKALLVTDLTSV